MSDEWPKPWAEIRTTDPDANVFSVSTSWVDLGPLRTYDGTVYINADAGRETDENRDRWLPLERYLTDPPDG